MSGIRVTGDGFEVSVSSVFAGVAANFEEHAKQRLADSSAVTSASVEDYVSALEKTEQRGAWVITLLRCMCIVLALVFLAGGQVGQGLMWLVYLGVMEIALRVGRRRKRRLVSDKRTTGT